MLHRICALLFLFIVGANSWCVRGKFGENCQLICHCNESTCSSFGDCTWDLCATGYGGPYCQYLNVATLVPNSPSFLVDYRDYTCNPDDKAATLFFDLHTGIRFFWLRLLVRRSEKSTEVDLKLNDKSNTCLNKRVRYAKPQHLDVYCDFSGFVNNFTIIGPVVPSICGMDIGAGRNAALFQSSHQSSINFPIDKNQPGRAVDGDRTTCSHTTVEPGGSRWWVTFAIPFVLYRVRVYNSNDPKDFTRLAGIIIQTYDESSQLVETNHGPSNISERLTDVHMRSHLAVKQLAIHARLNPKSDGILKLCEVEAYGAHLCPEGFYGFSCHNICSCSPGQHCDTDTGGCTKGCPRGFYGFQCKTRCPRFCRNGTCYTRSGMCQGCSAGYLGDMCNKLCPAGKYGVNCTIDCPRNCLDSLCNPVSGLCYKCQSKFMGRTCTDCNKGYYGPSCSKDCPEHCENQLCENSTGNCLSCLFPFQGDKCEDIYQPPLLYIFATIICFLLMLLTILLALSKPSVPSPEEEIQRPIFIPESVSEVPESTVGPATSIGDSETALSE